MQQKTISIDKYEELITKANEVIPDITNSVFCSPADGQLMDEKLFGPIE